MVIIYPFHFKIFLVPYLVTYASTKDSQIITINTSNSLFTNIVDLR